MKEKKLKGEEYLTRKGVLVPAKYCCRMKCAEKLTVESQKFVFENFLKSVTSKDQALSNRIKLSQKAVERKGRNKTGIIKKRKITARYFVTLDGKEINICKTMFQQVHGVTRGKVDIIIEKRASRTAFVGENLNGRHRPANVRDEERKEAITHINSFPKYESHYSRSHTSKLYLSPALTIAKIYDLYVAKRRSEGIEKPLCYSLYVKIFNELGYNIKKPSIDTCKTCDKLQNDIKSASHDDEQVGHSRLECDTDHARIERAKKKLSDIEIKIPHD
ncbi:dna-directed rna polymerases i ii and iii subunit rpabc2 [Holotrichia oblita]|uniref:Dna-directed rna polymerases i ii and iii subunit rpabc2 n=1 Tax=Holotrichia oblita TaxID=644536 RepID=A0ACB9SKM7_HOLOL|nr:dna-directed rna polymerases i ii and iii subunit rpabc2 [Holotrichia oblita]